MYPHNGSVIKITFDEWTIYLIIYITLTEQLMFVGIYNVPDT